MSVDTFKTYYADLLAFQYRDKPKARATVEALATQSYANDIVGQVNNAFDLETAQGQQLDWIAKYVGVPRNIGEPTPRPYFGFSRYSGSIQPNGFRRYNDAGINIEVIWYRYQFSGQNNTDLTDAQYRSVIKLKIITNQSDTTLYSIQKQLIQFFGGQIQVIDNKDMTLSYVVGLDVPLSESILRAYLPKPMGVGITFDIITDLTRFTSDGDARITSDGSLRVITE